MKLLYIILIAALVAGCAKKKEDGTIYCILPAEAAWITKLKSDYASCTCKTVFYQAIYKNQAVLEIRGIDPVCDGINIIYKADGTQWFTSADKTQYDDYRATAQQSTPCWQCSKDGQ